MWTYLALLLSAGVLITVFVRRWILVNRADKLKENPKEEKFDKYEKNLKKKRRVSRKDKEKVTQLCEKAEGMLKGGREDEAIKLLIQALAIDELHIEAQHKLAMLYMQKQMYSAAAALFKQLGELTEEAVHFSHLGLALYQQQEYKEAKKAYQRAVSLDDSRPQRFASLAAVYRSLGELQNAVIALNQAIEKDSENLTLLFSLVDTLVELEDYDNAERTLKRIVEIAPENEEAKEYLKKIKAMASTKED